ncbi:molybdenum cofactor guanylyltransferase MobA [Thiocystis violacea]|uniref:molybdenum cofactor guanylyltransferase MobA n=1 Tax=Thiocystis violacea TaxID=13725 RepID=UPI0019049098|nr:molybdenum cofactor guanylyltransferase MobA [Thiocystis violacea]MBK1723446.1 molybdenum cofactor guanylyltransferase [Thiocystis violacea]
MQHTSVEPLREAVTGVILAGGAGRRMGGLDKGLVEVAGRPLVEWVIDALSPQVGTLLISANRNLPAYAAYGFAVVQDTGPGLNGPLAGMLSAMRAATTPWILTLPCDTPHPPVDLRSRLARALIDAEADLSVALDGQRRHSVHALLPVALADHLAAYLHSGGRKVESWQAQHRVACADFSDRSDGFANLNSIHDVAAFERHITRTPKSDAGTGEPK